MKAFAGSLPGIIEKPRDIDARSNALYGAWLCGTVLGAVGMSLHHKICHVLGGSFDMPHAETHAVMLPHTAGFNAEAARTELAPAAAILGGSIGGGLWDFARSLGVPLTLRELGLAEADLDRAAGIAVQNPHYSPRPIKRRSGRCCRRPGKAARRTDGPWRPSAQQVCGDRANHRRTAWSPSLNPDCGAFRKSILMGCGDHGRGWKAAELAR